MGQVSKILVIGSLGMAGHVIKQHLMQTGEFEVYGIARNIGHKSDNTIELDISDTRQLFEVINQMVPDVIINCVGILNADAESNPEKAIWFNSYFPHLLASHLRSSSTRLIHISTDCVFSGKKGRSYLYSDFKDGEGFYAQTKALGEVINEKDITIRTSIIGPELKSSGIGLFHWFMSQPPNSTLKGFTNAFWSGITTIELAKVIYICCKENSVAGLLQVSADEKISKYELLKIFNRVFRTNTISVEPNDNYKVDKSLIPNYKSVLDYTVPSYDTMIDNMKQWVVANSELYSTTYDV